MLHCSVRQLLLAFLFSSTHTYSFDITNWLPTSWVARDKSEDTFSYQLGSTVQNIIIIFERGTITVDTWNNRKVTLHMIKYARSVEALQQIILETVLTDETLTINVTQADVQTKVDLNVFVPFAAHVTIISKQVGNITVSHAPQHLIISTMQGCIAVDSQQGSTIDSATEQGNIDIHCDSFSEQSSILARAPEGSITLRFSSSLDAFLEATTEKGVVEILYPLTIEYLRFPRFDKEHIKKFQKNVQGMIGTGGPRISLYASSTILVAPE